MAGQPLTRIFRKLHVTSRAGLITAIGLLETARAARSAPKPVCVAGRVLRK